jgi:hypothetical protein
LQRALVFDEDVIVLEADLIYGVAVGSRKKWEARFATSLLWRIVSEMVS